MFPVSPALGIDVVAIHGPGIIIHEPSGLGIGCEPGPTVAPVRTGPTVITFDIGL